jgi:hypothetical protein
MKLSNVTRLSPKNFHHRFLIGSKMSRGELRKMAASPV